jgi:hypothetical protein
LESALDLDALLLEADAANGAERNLIIPYE